MQKRKIILPLLLVLLISAGAAYYLTQESRGSPPAPSSNQVQYLETKQQTNARFEEPVNILVIGIDKASPLNGTPRPGPWRADVIIIGRIDPNKQQVRLLSIPRDTRVEIPGHAVEKIAHAHAYGEVPLTVETVENYTGLKFDHFVKVDFVAFTDMVDIMGGIEIDVPEKLNTKHYGIIEQGKQMMDGKQAYVYVTSRNDPMGDISRIERQQYFLYALLENVRDKAGTLDLARIYFEFKKNSQTSLALRDTIELTLFARKLQTDDIIMRKLPGRPEYIDGLSYWIPDQDGWLQLKKEMFDTEKL